MTVLKNSEILERCNLDDPGKDIGGGGLIDPCERARVRTAGYDLRVGDEFYRYDSESIDPKISKLDGITSGALNIPRNGVVLVKSHEKVKMDLDVVGHVSLKFEVLLKGVTLSNQSQIDAGYEGHIFVLLYNLSDHDQTLKFKEPFLRLEFATLSGETESYSGNIRNKKLADLVGDPLRSSLNKMQEEVAEATSKADAARKSLTYTQVLASVFIAALTVAGGFVTTQPLRDLGKLEERLNVIEKRPVESHTKKFSDLEAKQKALSDRLDLLEAAAGNTVNSRSQPNDTEKLSELEAPPKALMDRLDATEAALDTTEEPEAETNE